MRAHWTEDARKYRFHAVGKDGVTGDATYEVVVEGRTYGRVRKDWHLRGGVGGGHWESETEHGWYGEFATRDEAARRLVSRVEKGENR